MIAYYFRKLGKMSSDLSSAVVVVGALRVNLALLKCSFCDRSLYGMRRPLCVSFLLSHNYFTY